MSAVVIEPTKDKPYTKWIEADIAPRLVRLPERVSPANYLWNLERTVKTALLTALFSAIIGIFATGNLISFLLTNTSFLHPYLAIFLAAGSAALFVVAVVSTLTVKKRMGSVIGKAL